MERKGKTDKEKTREEMEGKGKTNRKQRERKSDHAVEHTVNQ